MIRFEEDKRGCSSNTMSFTLFEARSINFVTMVYPLSMHVDCRLASSQLLGSRRATWPRKRRQRRRRRQPRRKRSSRSAKPLTIRIASEVRYALCTTDRPQLSPTEYPRNNQSGRTIMGHGCCTMVRFFFRLERAVALLRAPDIGPLQFKFPSSMTMSTPQDAGSSCSSWISCRT